MKFKVVSRFSDMCTGEILLPGVSFECNEQKRIDDLIGRGLVKPLESGDADARKNQTRTKNKK